jgi:hypothetical protein
VRVADTPLHAAGVLAWFEPPIMARSCELAPTSVTKYLESMGCYRIKPSVVRRSSNASGWWYLDIYFLLMWRVDVDGTQAL